MAQEQLRSEADAVIDAAKGLLQSEQVLDDDKNLIGLVLPQGRTVKSLKPLFDEYLPAPERKVGISTHLTILSLIEHFNRTRDEGSVFFADIRRETPKLLAVYDYNQKDGAARFGQHRAEYAFPLSDEWKAWDGVDGETLEQADFALFIEDRIADIAQPHEATKKTLEVLERLQLGLADIAEPARMANLSQGLSVRVDVRVQGIKRLSSGECQISYSQENQDENGQPLKVPSIFIIAIPLFRGGDYYAIPVRLRYRVTGQRVTWSFALYRTEEIFDAAIQRELDRVKESTEAPIFAGFPEAAIK